MAVPSVLGSCLQALVKYLQGIADDDIPSLHVPIGIPVVYELDDNLNAVRNYRVGDKSNLTNGDRMPSNL